MTIKHVKGIDMKKDIQFQREQGLNINTDNSNNSSRNSFNSDREYQDGVFITATGKLQFNLNGQTYLVDVQKI